MTRDPRDGGRVSGERFVALCYPGSLAGRALGFNLREGFAWSHNSVSPRQHSAAGIRKYGNTATLKLQEYL